MATQGLHGPAAARADDEPSAVAVSFDHPVVTGGFLKKPWVPEVLLVDVLQGASDRLQLVPFGAQGRRLDRPNQARLSG